MHTATLVFLEDSRARRLAVAWAACKGNDKSWLETAGFDPTMVGLRPLCTMLKNNGICQPAGVVDELVLKYIGALATRELKKKR
jgi:hypothetical protein